MLLPAAEILPVYTAVSPALTLCAVSVRSMMTELAVKLTTVSVAMAPFDHVAL
jgi:hypothetical protein